MALINTHVGNDAGFSITQALRGLFERAKAANTRYLAYKRTLRELSGLTDRELADIGLGRGEIYAVAMNQADRT